MFLKKTSRLPRAHYLKCIVVFIITNLLSHYCKAQNGDSTDGYFRNSLNDIFTTAMDIFSKDPNDTLRGNEKAMLGKSEDAFKRYNGRHIRRIIVRKLGFEKKLSDTSRRLVTMGTKIYNALHTDTREWVIRDNLFIYEGDTVDAYKIADNERYIRTLDFMQDARILIRPAGNYHDSVDIIIVTKDLFTITGDIGSGTDGGLLLSIGDANFLGAGQLLQLTTLWDPERHPFVGAELLYKKINIAGSFINATVAYSQINTGISIGKENEHAWYMRLERPLYSPYARIAGGVELSRNVSKNVYNKADSIFFNYGYKTVDVWSGYNIGAHQRSRVRKFIAFRYLRNRFNPVPLQVGNHYDALYNNKDLLLGSFTFFKQNFYKTNYIYGFGTTEDLPHGYSIAVISGWQKQLQLRRPYFGVDANNFIATHNGAFYQLFVRAGGYYYNSGLEDFAVSIGGSAFSKLMNINGKKCRTFIRMSYTELFNKVTYAPLYINNDYGIRNYATDSVYGNRRINAYIEVFSFSNKKLAGFKFSPFIFTNAAVISPEHTTLFQSNVYTGFGGGIRTRNENLIFGTIEFRIAYFPRKDYDAHHFFFSLDFNLKFRYQTSYVNEPDVLQLNKDVYLQ